MMKAELLEIIRNGENSGVEFKRDDLRPDVLATEITALLNLEGGYILLGVEDDGEVSGLTRAIQETEQWVMNICRNNVQPAVIPYWETLRWDETRAVGIVTLPADSPDKPYKAKRGTAWVTYVRAGSTSREATREEEGRLYQSSHMMRYDIKPVSRTGYEQLESKLLENYFRDILHQDIPPADDREAWTTILLNTDILMEAGGKIMATTGGLLLFGETPNRFLPQAGITATAFPGKEKEYATVDEDIIRGPLVSFIAAAGEVLEKGVIDRAVDFVARNMGATAWLEGGRRQRKPAYPPEAVREAIVNAVAHRDYTITVTDIEISLYQDRMEVISPGRLPNGVTVQKMKQGYRASRNELLKEILRDYGYVEHRGMGVRNHILIPMRLHNHTEPDLIEEETRFTVRLWKESKGRAAETT